MPILSLSWMSGLCLTLKRFTEFRKSRLMLAISATWRLPLITGRPGKQRGTMFMKSTSLKLFLESCSSSTEDIIIAINSRTPIYWDPRGKGFARLIGVPVSRRPMYLLTWHNHVGITNSFYFVDIVSFHYTIKQTIQVIQQVHYLQVMVC